MIAINIDMPVTCAECPCLRNDSQDGVQGFQCNITLGIRKNIDRKPKWCPLIQIQRKETGMNEAEIKVLMSIAYRAGIKDGWDNKDLPTLKNLDEMVNGKYDIHQCDDGEAGGSA